jgi:ABC-2 type transport system permease protein
MASTDSTAIPDPSLRQPAGGLPSFTPAALSTGRLLYWSVRRELWENRYVYVAPLIVAAVFLFGFAVGAIHLPLARIAGAASLPEAHLLERPFDFASFAVMAIYVIITVIYCLGALHNERSDRSILFWKSLPVSDNATVLGKASIPLVILPWVTFAVIAGTQAVMMLIGSATLLARGLSAAVLWAQIPLLSMWAAVLYHLITVHTLYWAPFYAWMLLVSAWARRAAFLWASLPIVAVLIIEKLVFNTSLFGRMLLSQLGGGPAALDYPPRGTMPMQAPTLANLAAFLASPGLWIGLAVCASLLVAAARLRRRQGPI